MKIFNLRANFSNNSSSDHSIIFVPNDKLNKIHDEMYDGDQCFGWEQFTLKSKEYKKDYLIASIYNATKNDEFITNVFGKKADPEGYVDHQSELTFPNNLSGKINYEFIKDYCDYIINTDNIIILGGNDNGGTHKFDGVFNNDEVKIKLDTERDSFQFIAEKFDDYWVFLNKNNGYKTRFSFNNDAIIPIKSKVPELVDIKITDYCPYNCEFCYQGSTIKGKHVSLEFIKELAEEFSQNRVLEVALGGGEPTLHPSFLEILQIFNNYNIAVNFTTKNKNIFNDEIVLETASSIAYSVTNIEDIIEITKKINFMYNVSFQIVMGTIPKLELEKILEFCDSSYFWSDKLTLLGFKPVERGLNYEKIEYDWLLHLLKYKGIKKIGFDTLLVQEFEEMLKLMEVNSVFYNSTEAAFSCYIDAVNKKIAPTSYCDADKYRDFTFDNWIPTYQSF